MTTTNQLIREFEKVLGVLPKTPAKRQFKRHEQARVPVYSRSGAVLTTILKQCTSIGAAKAAKAKSCEWSFRFGAPGWVVKE